MPMTPGRSSTPPPLQRSAFWSYLVLGGGVLSLGFSPIFIRWADAPGTVTSMYRMAFAALALAVPFLRTLRRTGSFPRHALWMTICGGFFFALDIGFWSTGVVLGGATNPTLLDTIAPLWVGLFSVLFFKQHLGKQFWIGLAIALTGAVMILGFDLQTDLRQAQGALLGLVGGIFYGGYVMFIERGRAGLGALACFWISTASAAFFLLLFNIAARHALSGYDSVTVLAFLGAGLLNQIGGFLSVTFALGYLPSTIVSPALLIQPLAVAFLAGPLLNERIHLWQVPGGAAVLFGLYLIQRSQSRNAPPPPSTH
ncbi:MAG: DMT family transporter [Anaerolineales bacterium]|nr:DMT family transporter [Anaerolineales bacterium]